MKNLLEEILNQLIEDALEIKNNGKEEDFVKGQLIGYYLSISKILNQAEAFGIADKLPKNLREFDTESLFS